MKTMPIELLLLVGAGLCAYGLLKNGKTIGFKVADGNASPAAANTVHFGPVNRPVRRLINHNNNWQWAERN
jgi:hypothetical protein